MATQFYCIFSSTFFSSLAIFYAVYLRMFKSYFFDQSMLRRQSVKLFKLSESQLCRKDFLTSSMNILRGRTSCYSWFIIRQMGQINPLFWHLASTQTKLKISPLCKSPAGHLAQDRLIFLISPIIEDLSKILQNLLTQNKWNEFIKQLIYMIQEPEQSGTQEGFSDKLKRNKKIVMSVFIVILAIICFSFSIFAMSSAVVYFSFVFSSIDELYAKAYLKLYYTWFMATTYMSIFGLVIVLADTAVHFTKFSQKERILWLHIGFYLAFFICGIVALAGGTQYLTKMISLAASACTLVNSFECTIALPFIIYRGQVTSYFIGYCITFFAYAALYHYASYSEKRQLQEANLNKHQLNNTEMVDAKPKNQSSLSIDESSL